jgi:hypothetical protein
MKHCVVITHRHSCQSGEIQQRIVYIIYAFLETQVAGHNSHLSVSVCPRRGFEFVRHVTIQTSRAPHSKSGFTDSSDAGYMY